MIPLEEVTFTVKQLSDILKACFDREEFSSISVMGEIYSLKIGTKFSYLEIGDQDSDQSKAAILKVAVSMFDKDTSILYKLKKGDIVKVKGKISYYPHGSSITMWASYIESILDQKGKNLLKKRKILEKLDKMGYLNPERKKQIPANVKLVGIITAKNSAAYSDIITTLKGRFPVSTILYPCLVQGESSSKSMVKAIKLANDDKVDIIILGRGGGSETDLSSFDDEELAISIAESKVPVITCIGHSIDEAIADKVADKVAITPTEAGKLVNISLDDVYLSINNYKNELKTTIINLLHNYEVSLNSYKERLNASSINSKLNLSKNKLNGYINELKLLIDKILTNKSNLLQNSKNNLNNIYLNRLNYENRKINSFKVELEKYNDNSILERGYIKIFKDDKLIKSSKLLSKDDEIKLSFIDGNKKAIIK